MQNIDGRVDGEYVNGWTHYILYRAGLKSSPNLYTIDEFMKLFLKDLENLEKELDV